MIDTRAKLFLAMCKGTLVTIGDARGAILAISLEDASGYKFNVTLIDLNSGNKLVKFVGFPKPTDIDREIKIG